MILSENLAYWVGVAQSDGCLREYFEKNRNLIRNLVSFTVARKSLPMLEKFSDVSEKVFNRKAKIFKLNKHDFWTYNIRVSDLLDDFKRLDIRFKDPPTPPNWSLEEDSFFGAYLAGLIDGDGDVRIKRKKYPQCAIRITSSTSQDFLKEWISRMLGCGVSIAFVRREKEIRGKKFVGSAYILEFYISKKNIDFVRKHIVPNIAISYKKDKLLSFIQCRCPG